MSNKITNSIGDKFKCKDFLGFVFITSIHNNEICLTYEHVSGENNRQVIPTLFYFIVETFNF